MRGDHAVAVAVSTGATADGTVCRLAGLITGGAWSHMLLLPLKCRPRQRQIYTLNHNEATVRVDVTPSGVVEYKTGKTSHAWISLSMIEFTTGGTRNDLTSALYYGWSNYGKQPPPLPSHLLYTLSSDASSINNAHSGLSTNRQRLWDPVVDPR